MRSVKTQLRDGEVRGQRHGVEQTPHERCARYLWAPVHAARDVATQLHLRWQTVLHHFLLGSRVRICVVLEVLLLLLLLLLRRRLVIRMERHEEEEEGVSGGRLGARADGNRVGAVVGRHAYEEDVCRVDGGVADLVDA